MQDLKTISLVTFSFLVFFSPKYRASHFWKYLRRGKESNTVKARDNLSKAQTSLLQSAQIHTVPLAGISSHTHTEGEEHPHN